MRKFFISLLIGNCCACFGVEGQSLAEGLSVGTKIPDLDLKEIAHYSGKSISSRELEGKYVILDFWTPGCTSCIESFVKYNALQKQFKDLELILVGRDNLFSGAYELAKASFQKYKKRWDLRLSVVYDSLLFNRFKITAVPSCVWIDNRGTVKAITYSTDVNAKNIIAFLSRQPIDNSIPSTGATKTFDYNKPLLVDGNGGNEFLFRSVLAGWQPGTGGHWPRYISTTSNFGGTEPNRIQIYGASLKELIQLAYGDTIEHLPSWYSPHWKNETVDSLSSYEKIWLDPLLEINDTTTYRGDWKSGRNIYSYSLIIPMEKATAANLQAAMRRDLETYFNYDIMLETRSMPCWYLAADPESRRQLVSHGATFAIDYNPTGINLRNVPVYQLIRLLFAYNSKQPPIINSTGINGHIDIELNAAMMDFDDVINALKKKGLYLKRGRKDMKVIIVRDRRG